MTKKQSLSPQAVADWLRQHPDLLCHYPDLIDTLELPNPEQAVSLAQHQVARLRQGNQRLAQQLKQLTTIAGENERLMQRLHQLTLDVMSAPSDNAFVDRLLVSMQRDFSADEVRLHLFQHCAELLDHAGVVGYDSDPPEWLGELVSSDKIYCGRLTRHKLGRLFPDTASPVGSCALVPLAGTGLLAVGSLREDHFHPGIGTLFLDLIGSTIARRLDLGGQEDRKRA